MLVLLPPSETKREGGTRGPLDVAQLAHPRLTPARRALIRAVRALARDEEASRTALKLGARQSGEVAHNRALTTSPTLPAVDRYTGVLYDALDAGTLAHDVRERAGRMLRIGSALFGLVGGLDPIPAYRLSHDSRVPGFPLKAHWATRVARELAEVEEPMLDLRSEGYAALGPTPDRPDCAYLRVVTRADDGATRALNHFNKKGKGLLVRALLETPAPPATLDELLDWAPDAGFELRRGRPGELELVLA